jgi:hypothetical protein
MATDPTLIFIKASAVDSLLKLVPDDYPGWRETSIQSAKLLRMLSGFIAKYERRLGPLKRDKSARKDYGEDVRRLRQQEKVMSGLVNKLMEEHWVRTSQGTRKSFRKDVQKLNVAFDSLVYMAMENYKKEITKLMGVRAKRSLKA